MKARSVATDPQFGAVRLEAPSTSGFVYVAAQSGERRRPGPVFGRDRRRVEAVAALRACAGAVAGRGDVRAATVFQAVLLTPAVGGLLQPDATLLIETTTPVDARALAASDEVAAMKVRLCDGGARVEVIAARNVRRIADVEHRPGRAYLFNHFAADDPEIALEVWERLAAWYQQEMGLENSVLLAPADGDDPMFTLVNHAAFRHSLPQVALRQFTSKTFYTYVQATLKANDIDVVPAFYRLAGRVRPRLVTLGESPERGAPRAEIQSDVRGEIQGDLRGGGARGGALAGHGGVL